VKEKTCSICGQKRSLWRSNPPTCKNCVQRKKIAQTSEKRKITLKSYSNQRKDFLQKNAVCKLKLSRCTSKATVIHHTKGKSSEELYLDEKFWMASCWNCNLDVETYEQAYEEGLKIHRNQI
jgi:hypothetical protein